MSSNDQGTAHDAASSALESLAISEPLSPTEEAEAILKLFKVKLVAGEKFALIDAKWWKMWKAYTGFDDMKLQVSHPAGYRPGPIDNSRLQSPECELELRKDINEFEHFNLVHDDVWRTLVGWYGGGPAFVREVIELGNKKTRVDMYPLIIRLQWCDMEGTPLPETRLYSLSQKDTLKGFVQRLFNESKAEAKYDSDQEPDEAADIAPLIEGDEEEDEDEERPAPIQLWLQDQEDKEKWNLLEGKDLTLPLENFQYPSNTVFLAERRNPDGSFPRVQASKDWRDFRVGDILDARDTVSKWYESTVRDVKEDKVLIHFNGWAQTWDEWLPKDSDRLAPKNTHTTGPRQVMSTSRWGYMGNEEGQPEAPGVVGLANLGNTCFMNSTLQCLSHTPFLTDFFLSDTYLSQINKDNPLGWQGRVAEEYGAMVKEIWSGKYRVVSPVKFKQVLGEFAPRFSGYQQQDSSELLSFLLDGLHEDLNQVRVKPATSAVESKGRPDSEVAAEAWNTYSLRNKSVIVDTLQGQLKSRLVCPTCARVSITFDPFMFLSAPLPSQKDKAQTCAFVPLAVGPAAESLRSNPDAYVPQLVAATVPFEGTIKDLKASVARLMGVPAGDLVAADVFGSRCYRILNDHYAIGEIQANDHVYLYQVMPLPQTTSTSAPAPEPSSSASAPNETTETAQESTPGAGAAVGTDVEAGAGAGTSSGTGTGTGAVDADSDDDGVSIRISRPIGPVAAGTSTDNDAWDDDDEGTSYGPLSLGSSYFDSSSKGPAYAQICHQKTEKNSYFGTYKLAREFNVEAVGTPVLISVPTELTIGEARTMVLQAIAPFLRAEPLAPIAAAAAAIAAMESAGEPPFRIVVLDQGARNCAKCSLGLGCDGCELAGDDNALLSKEYKGRVAFGIRWSAHQFERYYINKGKYETLHEHETVKQIREAERDTSKEVVRLEDCIHLFTQEETLSKEDPWYCSTCKDFVQANKKFDLWRLPNIFVVHLKRFSFTRMWRDKLDTLVDFPIEGLDVSQFCANAEEKNTMYDLYAISNHYGGMGGGHYTAYCKNLRNGKWYHHDDSHVSPVSEKELKTSAAYVLYYRRRQD